MHTEMCKNADAQIIIGMNWNEWTHMKWVTLRKISVFILNVDDLFVDDH